MEIQYTFDPKTTEHFLERIEKLTPETQALWGKMNVGQMLAHLNVSYDMAYGHTVANYNFFMKLMLKMFVKKIVVGEKPYAKNSRTAPAFIVADAREFEKEKVKLIAFIEETEKKGVGFFEGKESGGFGELTAKEWSNMFSKHLNHHLSQFGV